MCHSCIQGFDSFKANEIEHDDANLELACLSDSIPKEKSIFIENFGEFKC